VLILMKRNDLLLLYVYPSYRQYPLMFLFIIFQRQWVGHTKWWRRNARILRLCDIPGFCVLGDCCQHRLPVCSGYHLLPLWQTGMSHDCKLTSRISPLTNRNATSVRHVMYYQFDKYKCYMIVSNITYYHLTSKSVTWLLGDITNFPLNKQ